MGGRHQAISFRVEDGLAILELDRPDSRNALDITMRNEIRDLLPEIRADRSLHALLLTGSGGAFCAGGDLKALSEGERSSQQNRERIRLLHVWFRELVDLELPVVAAVDGPAFGAGFNLALAADFVLCSTRAKFCAVFGRIGLIPDLGGFFLLPRTVGMHRAKDLVLTARTVGAEEAQRIGIVTEVFAPEDLRAGAIAFANRFKHASRDAIGIAKGILNQSFNLDQHALSEMEAFGQAVCISSDYHREAVRRFLGKEPLPFDWDRLRKEGQ